jgi:hypothetical protein
VKELVQVVEDQKKFQEKLVGEMTKKKTITAKSSSGATLTATLQ